MLKSRHGFSRGGRNARLAASGARLGDTDPGADGERVSVPTLGEGCKEFEACESGHDPQGRRWVMRSQ